MRETVRQDILSILRDALKALQNDDIEKLRSISNHTVHDSSIFQDKDSVTIAIVMYSLSKIFQKKEYTDYKGWDLFYDKCIDLVKEADSNLKKGNFRKYSICMHNMFRLIGKLEEKLGKYITEVLVQAKIKKGGKIYEHGISAGRAAELLGISSWELMNYLGHTKISDIYPVLTKSAEERLRLTRSLFT